MIAFFQALILRDFWLKLFSFVLAVLIWIIITIAIQNEVSPVTSLSLAPLDQRTFGSLPVMVMSSAEDVRNLRVNPKEVEVTVQGDPKTIKKLQAKDIRVLVDLTGIQTAHDLRKRIEVSTPAGITHVRVEPEEVQVIFPSKG